MKKLIWLLAGMMMLAGHPALASEEAGREAELEQRLEEARERLNDAAREIGELTGELHGDAMRNVVRMVRRGDGKPKAMIGISIGETNENGKVTGVSPDGVYVLGVSPGGPAEEAGLKTGDVLTRLNGQTLEGGGKASTDKLVAIMDKVKPGDKVTVEYLRDGKKGKVDLVTEEMSAPFMTGFVAPGGGEVFRWDSRDGTPMPPMPAMPPMPDMPMIAPMLARRWGGLELVPLTPKLGEYFNTDKGLLVVRAPDMEGLELEEGDVILQIGEREPKDVRHAMRILRSYAPGETAEIQVMRKKRKRKITYQVKEGEALGAAPGFEYRFGTPA
ncbi:MAG: PDZ domain-containing protein, partial [Gammaproteobacteria bacterium]|nr:PDZ domain-containing protein [Gammaproteobacteria bacterium]